MVFSTPSAGQAAASDLTVSDVVVNFQGLRAIDGVSLRLRRGEVLGLIGPNGAGKTTLVNVLTGFQQVDSGDVRLAGADIARWKPHERSRRGLVRTFQSVLPFGGLTALENVEAGAMATGISRKAARQPKHRKALFHATLCVACPRYNRYSAPFQLDPRGYQVPPKTLDILK